MLSPADRALAEALVPKENPRECGYFYEDEVPEGISEAGWHFLMDLCRYRIIAANRSAYPPGKVDTYSVAWDEAHAAGLCWPGFDREPPTAFRAVAGEGDAQSDG